MVFTTTSLSDFLMSASDQPIQTHSPPRSPGRPRCEAARKAILDAANALLRTRPLTEITSAAIAKAAGVSKATLYRWWPSKEAVVLEAYFESMDESFDNPPTDDPLADLRRHIEIAYRNLAGPDGEIFAMLVASGHFHPDVMSQLNDQMNSPRCKETETHIERAIRAGQLRPGLDPELITELLYGPLFGRLMTQAPIEPDLAERTFDLVLRGLHAE